MPQQIPTTPSPEIEQMHPTKDVSPRVEGPEHYKALWQLVGATGLISERDNEIAALREQALTDKLTGIANREALVEQLDGILERADNGERTQPILLFIDLDNFKKANDTLGHAVGDDLLIKVADGLSNEITVREDKDEMIARIGGDEFVALIFPENNGNSRRDKSKSEEDILKGFIGRLDSSVKDAAAEAGAPFVGASIGVAHRQPGESAEALMNRADAEMYAEKERRKAQNPDTASSR